MPTFAEIAGASLPEGAEVDGVSLKPYLYGDPDAEKTKGSHEFFYWESGPAERLKQAVRMENWKAMRASPGRSLELYDLIQDPGEQRDVAKENPEVVSRIESYLATCRRDPSPLPDPLPLPDPHWDPSTG